MHHRAGTSSKDENPTSENSEIRSSRQHSQLLTQIIQWDKQITRKCSWYASAHDPQVSQMRTRMIWMEWSCHGIPILSAVLVCLWFAEDSWYQQYLLNMFIALTVDLIIVGIVKSATRRRRPSNNHDDMFGTLSLDKYAFPSGHAVRAVLLSLIICYKGEAGFIISTLGFIWAVGICASRILLGRHHVGDVLGGIVQGILEYWFMVLIWLDDDSTKYVLKAFKTFESFHVLDGGE